MHYLHKCHHAFHGVGHRLPLCLKRRESFSPLTPQSLVSKMAQNNDLASNSLDNEREPLLPQEKNGRYKSSRKQNRDTADSSSDTSSDSSHSTLRRSWSPHGTSVKSLTTPNENNVAPENDDVQPREGIIKILLAQLLLLNIKDNMTPAIRYRMVRLEDNEEYPIKRHCLHGCTNKIFRNRK